MSTRVLLTVDTELRWCHYARGAAWQENLALSFDPAGVGVPYQLKVLRECGLKACFFVDPMPALLYGLEPIRRMIEPILAAGQEVQLHLHPCWSEIAMKRANESSFNLSNLDVEAQHALISTARDLLVEAGAPHPIAFRAGSFAADDATLDALRNLGVRYDSSHNGSLHPMPSGISFCRKLIAPAQRRGVIEIPITQIESSPGALRHLQLCAVSSKELRDALQHAAVQHHPLITIVSHSFELASRDGLRANRMICRRFERLCSFLQENEESLPTTHFSDLGEVRLDHPAYPLPARRLRTAGRQVQQLWSNMMSEYLQ